MKICLKPFAALFCLAGMVSPIYAATASDAQVERLESQLSSLEKEVASLKRQVRSDATHPRANAVGDTRNVTVRTPKTATAGALPASHGSATSGSQYHLSRQDLIHMANEEREYLPFDLDVPGQAFVSTGPYVGVPIQYAGSNLVINSPSVNTDLQLLNIRKSIHEQLLAMNGQIDKEPYHSHLLLSGVIETQANYTEVGGGPNTSDIDVTNVSLDAFFIGPSNWTLGFIELSHDSGVPFDSQYRVFNSRLFVNKAFITIGDFSRSPFYGTFGQFYVPFGRYSSVLIADPLTKLLTRTKARSILVGFQERGDNALYASAYIFRGDSHAASVSRINNGGINIGYKYKYNIFHGDFGGGVIGNIADSGGMQLGNGFADSVASEQLVHRVPGYNLRGIFSFGNHIDIITEYVTASTSFNPNNMSFNGSGAKPWAIDLEAAYSFMMFDNKPSAVALVYDHSAEALSLGIPMSRTAFVFNTSLWRNTLQSLELRHDRNYAASDTANGPITSTTVVGTCTSSACSESGKADNAITVSFDYYF